MVVEGRRGEGRSRNGNFGASERCIRLDSIPSETVPWIKLTF